MKKIIILLFIVIGFSSCVSRHPKCAAYDRVQNVEVK